MHASKAVDKWVLGAPPTIWHFYNIIKSVASKHAQNHSL